MHLSTYAGLTVAPAKLRAVLAREAAQRAADQAHARAVLADYLATSRHPLGRLVLPAAPPPRPLRRSHHA